MNRREFIATVGAGFVATRLSAAAPRKDVPLVKFGMLTDVHYAKIPSELQGHVVYGRRCYSESKRKVEEAVALFNAHRVDFAIELGDWKDLTAGKPQTLECLREIEGAFASFAGPRYHVFGNHDFDCLTPVEFCACVSNDGKPMTSGHYAFTMRGVRFVVLDACYDSAMRHYSENNPWEDANVPPEELAWLERELAAASAPAVVFCHQRLDPFAEPYHLIKNAAAVRDVIERSGKVRTVFTGHQHNGAINVYAGVDYYSLRALVCGSGVESNSFAEAEIYADGTTNVVGWRRAVSFKSRGETPPLAAG